MAPREKKARCHLRAVRLHHNGCLSNINDHDIGQGYLLGGPAPIEEITARQVDRGILRRR
ncbi:hypothetical protein [Rhizobium binae]|uniref:hypothetical protein n=1 Tax=Rhizobium binae TaxID=1138190 RepID=UPI001C83FE94|nr:hypothetical protein [Rhizobium binae]MBX4946491.1 hypothetical protein [Rhizobium binae]MBX4982386.1 hypothetical protein [Rhizobium binae]